MILICGIPNAGKTTYSQRYSDVIHFDEVSGGRRRRQIVVEMVEKNPSVCVEGVYKTVNERIALVNASSKHNICIWITTPIDVCIDREINGRNRSVHMVQWAYEGFEPPTYDEGWDEIYILKNDVLIYQERE